MPLPHASTALDALAIARLEIRDLIERSSDAINHQDWPAFSAMMTKDLVWERRAPTPWLLEGHDTVREFLTGNSTKLDILHYVISGCAIEIVDATHASARSTMSELILMRQTAVTLRVVGTYEDRFVKEDGAWSFARRTITPRYEQDVTGVRVMSSGQLS
jgi:hypothetical protein